VRFLVLLFLLSASVQPRLTYYILRSVSEGDVPLHLLNDLSPTDEPPANAADVAAVDALMRRALIAVMDLCIDTRPFRLVDYPAGTSFNSDTMILECGSRKLPIESTHSPQLAQCAQGWVGLVGECYFRDVRNRATTGSGTRKARKVESLFHRFRFPASCRSPSPVHVRQRPAQSCESVLQRSHQYQARARDPCAPCNPTRTLACNPADWVPCPPSCPGDDLTGRRGRAVSRTA